VDEAAHSRGDHKIAVHAKGIVKSFGDGGSKLTVLKGIDFDARDGEIMMLVGPSGCGKTTLLSILAGTLRSEQGSVEVFGQQIDKMSSGRVTKFRSQNIGFIFQSFNLIPTLNCAENVSVPLLIQGVSPRKAEARAREVLASVGLGERWKHRPNQLSGGQQQRVAIARALVHEPRLIICDEPTAALDAKNGVLVMDLFEKIARVPGRCVIIVTHDNRIFSHADRIAQMDDGQIVEVHDVDRAEPPVFHH
jgi:putative ABC transport system ATP-binding protein